MTTQPQAFSVRGAYVPAKSTKDSHYVLATGSAGVRRLQVLHSVCAPTGRRFLLEAGLRSGMRVADFGCGPGFVTRMLAQIVGPTGTVVGIDSSAQQLSQASAVCWSEGVTNVGFVEVDACRTGLPRESFDLVYCRFLLMHLPDPAACLREMFSVLRPGGILVVEDGDLTTAGSSPATVLNRFGGLFARLGAVRGVNYSLGSVLYPMVKATGFAELTMELHQPVMPRGEGRYLIKWTLEEAAPSMISAGLITPSELERTLEEMQRAIDNEDVLVLMPLMSLVAARRPLA